MTLIECPHCTDAIIIEQGAFGLFDCPSCDEEFSYHEDQAPTDEVMGGWIASRSLGTKLGLGILAFGVVAFLGLMINEGSDCTEFGCGMWVVIPMGIWSVGGLVLLVSFLSSMLLFDPET